MMRSQESMEVTETINKTNNNKMKHVQLYESYLSEKYITYDKLGKWGKYSNESEVEDDLRMTVINMFLYAGISNKLDDVIYTDQSSDKGIKWEIEVKGKGSDIIHVYKDGKFRGEYEWYLNKKRSSKADIQQYFLDKLISTLDQYLAQLKGFDFYYHMADDSRAYKRGQAQADALKQLYSKLNSSDQKRAHAEWLKASKTQVDIKQFQGA